jgi:formate dehydrogenase maturation protein FdhE
MRTSLEEGIKLHRFAGMFPEQFLTEAGRQREAVVAADVWWYLALGGATAVTILTQCPVCPSPPVASFAASLVHRIMMV